MRIRGTNRTSWNSAWGFFGASRAVRPTGRIRTMAARGKGAFVACPLEDWGPRGGGSWTDALSGGFAQSGGSGGSRAAAAQSSFNESPRCLRSLTHST